MKTIGEYLFEKSQNLWFFIILAQLVIVICLNIHILTLLKVDNRL